MYKGTYRSTPEDNRIISQSYAVEFRLILVGRNMFLERRAFRDHETLEELLTIHSTQEQRAFQIH